MSSLLFCLMGPTASGKTDLALKLQQVFPFEIVSVDSAMVYKSMDIGSAKPSKEFHHYLVDICNPNEPYSVGKFCEDALGAIKTIESHGKIPLLTGGTMLYFRALQKGLSPLPKTDAATRNKIHDDTVQLGTNYLHQKLSDIDPISAKKIHPNDTQRLSRALEIYEMTGTPMSSLYLNQQTFLEGFQVFNIGLMPSNRDTLKQKIAQRFDLMLEAGLISEVEKLMHYKDTSAMRAVNYSQVSDYLEGKIDFKTMREKAIIATAQLAKRQMTWLRHFGNITFFDPDSPRLLDDVVLFISTILLKK